jgi:hypothetical protein
LFYVQIYAVRGEMAFNYHKVSAEAEAITAEVYTCENARNFAAKNLYTNGYNN